MLPVVKVTRACSTGIHSVGSSSSFMLLGRVRSVTSRWMGIDLREGRRYCVWKEGGGADEGEELAITNYIIL